MKLNNGKFKIVLILFCLILSGLFLASKGEAITAELLNLKTENNILLIEVAKRYPEIRFSKFENPNKVLIELLDSKYHNQFKFDDLTKSSILESLDFISDFTVGTAKYDDNKTKISIIITLREDYKPFPRVISTKNNLISISFNEPINQEPIAEKLLIKEEKEPPQETIDTALESLKELYNKAVDETLNRNIEQAEELYKELISKDNNFYPARYNLAKILFDKKDYEKSQEILTPLIADISNNNTDSNLLLLSRNLLGLTFLLNEKYEEAIAQFDEIIKANPSQHDAFFNLGIIYEKQLDIEKAISYFSKAIEINPDYIDAYYHLGILHLITKNKKEAIANLEKVFSLSPDSNFGKLSEKELQKLEKRKFKSHK